MSELAFEHLAVALEATRGTLVTPPTHLLNLAGTLTPKREKYRPNESRGVLAEFFRSKTVRATSEWEAEGPLDLNTLPVLLNMAVKAVTSPSTPGGATNSRLWTFTPTMTSDDIKVATLYWGDPNVKILQSAYSFIDELTINADASGTDGTTVSVKGMGKFPTALGAAPTWPAQDNGELVVPGAIQVWIDSGTIGTTAITGRVISVKHVIRSGAVPKYLAQGPTSDLGYSSLGRKKRHIETTLVMELPDMTQYNQWAADTSLKVRVRHNGSLIEDTFYYYLEVDTYGPFDALSWGDYEGANRTIELTVWSEYNSGISADFSIKVENIKTSL